MYHINNLRSFKIPPNENNYLTQAYNLHMTDFTDIMYITQALSNLHV
jgi:hypothetical protein